MMKFLDKKTSQAIILFLIFTVIPLLYSSGYRLSAYQAAENHFGVKGKDPQLFDEVELGWGTVFLFDTKEVPHTVLSNKSFGFLWRASAATRSLAFDDAVKAVGWMRYFHKNDVQVTVLAVKSSDPDVAYIEAGPLEHRTRKTIEPESHVIFYWPEYWHGLCPFNVDKLDAVALSEEGETLYEYRYSEENAFRNGEPRFYPAGKGEASDSLQQIEIKATAEESQPTAEELGICYHDYGVLANHIVKILFEYDFQITLNGDPQKLREPYTVEGKYDLNADNKADIIQVYFSALSAISSVSLDRTSKIRVNNAEIDAYFHNPRGVYIIDFNKEDKFKELVIFDDGPSGDPEIFLYRYNGIEVVELGSIGGDIGIWLEKSSDAIRDEDLIVEASGYTGPYYGAIKTDGRGRILSPNNVVEFISPEIILGISEIKEEGVKHIKIDYSRMLNKEYEIKEDFRTFFTETVNDLKDLAVMSWDEKNMISFKKGEKIFLEGITEYGARYHVKLQNGKKGIIYFWAGD